MHPVKFLSRGRGGRLWWPAGLLLCDVAHKYGDDLIRFSLSTDNQNGRHLAISFFLYFFSDFPRNLVYIGFRGLRVYWHSQFSCATENEAMAAILIFKFNNSLLTR